MTGWEEKQEAVVWCGVVWGGAAGHGNDSAATLVIRNAFTGPVNKLNVCTDSAGRQAKGKSNKRGGERDVRACN